MARPRSKKGEAIRPERRNADALAELEEMIAEAKAGGDLLTWRRGVAIRRYVEGRRAVDIAQELEVVRGSVNQWLRWYDTLGVEGLVPRKAPGAPPKLSPEQMEELGHLIDEGPIAAGFSSGMWTGPMVGELIQQRLPGASATLPCPSCPQSVSARFRACRVVPRGRNDICAAVEH